MKRAQLIEVTETTIYIKDGQIVGAPSTSNEKLHHAIYGETRTMKTETVIERWNLKTKKDAEKRFWDWCEENKKDFRNHYIVFAED